MSNIVIVDTSALLSLFSPQDSNHQKAKDISIDIKNRDATVVIPGEIFTETLNVLGKKTGHEVAVKHGEAILGNNRYRIIDTNPEMRLDAFKKFRKQSRSVSFTDCVVMAVADYYETKDIFGFDKIFSKNGYNIV